MSSRHKYNKDVSKNSLIYYKLLISQICPLVQKVCYALGMFALYNLAVLLCCDAVL